MEPFWSHCYSIKSLPSLILGGYICTDLCPVATPVLERLPLYRENSSFDNPPSDLISYFKCAVSSPEDGEWCVGVVYRRVLHRGDVLRSSGGGKSVHGQGLGHEQGQRIERRTRPCRSSVKLQQWVHYRTSTYSPGTSTNTRKKHPESVNNLCKSAILNFNHVVVQFSMFIPKDDHLFVVLWNKASISNDFWAIWLIKC